MWSDYIQALRDEFTGRKVMYQSGVYRVAGVDMNGMVHIAKPSRYTNTTAVYTAFEARKHIVK